jgi:hypothetical protein
LLVFPTNHKGRVSKWLYLFSDTKEVILMPNEIREIVKEYVMDVPDLEHTVKGRITMNPEVDGNLRYMWEISHHYRPSENAAGVYYPSKLHAPTAEEAESHLKGYMSCFTTLDVTPNEDY